MSTPDSAPNPTPSAKSTEKQPHWLAVVALLIGGLAVAGLISYLGSTTLTT